VKIGDIASIIRGASPRPIKAYITYDKNGVNWIKIGDVKPDAKFITETKEKITFEGAKKSRLVKEGDFIISNSMSVGRPYIVKITGCIHDGWLLLSNFSENINRGFFYHLLMSEKCQNNFKDVAKGGTSVDNLNIDRVSNIKLPLPPLSVQQKIVSEIEKLENQEQKAKNEIEKLKGEIGEVIQNMSGEQKSLSEIANIQKGTSITKQKIKEGNIPVIAGGKTPAYFHNISNRDGNVITVSASGANSGFVNFFTTPIFASDCNTIISKDEQIISTKLIYEFLKSIQNNIYKFQRGQAQPHVYAKDLAEIKLPLPPLEIQQKIVSEIEKLEVRISELEKELKELPKMKEEVLKKYL